MQAIVYHRYGSPDVLEVANIDAPCPVRNQVRIRVHSASVNPYDWHFVRGRPRFIRAFTGIGHPRSQRLGADVSGVVDAVGPDVKHLKPGDAVFGTCKGSFAELACGPESQLARKPEGLSFEHAAALPIAGITALQGLRDCGRLRENQSVLIHGAAGGVGTFAVQIAKSMGAWATGVCSTRNVDLVRSLGADLVLDYTREDFARLAFRYDIVFDLVGDRPLAAMRHVLKPKGVYVGCGGGGPDTPSLQLLGKMLHRILAVPFVSQRLTGVLARINTRDLQELAVLVRQGKLKPVLDRQYQLATTAEAIRYVEKGHARGKVIIAVA